MAQTLTLLVVLTVTLALTLTAPLTTATPVTDDTVDIKGRIYPNGLDIGTRVLLHSSDPAMPPRTAVPDAAGRFMFPGLAVTAAKAVYRVDVVSMEHEYRAVRVSVQAGKAMRATAANDTSVRLTYPLVLHPIAPAVFITATRSSSILSMIFANPMILMMVVMGGLSMLMPKLMENMDEEELKEIRSSGLAKSQAQAQNMDIMGSITDFAASLTAEDDRPSTRNSKKKNRR